MKKLPAFLGMLMLSPVLAASVPSRYLDSNITRTYYMDELEHCPGVLEMNPGDLWTLTFPDNIRDSFITREGVIDRQVIENRLIVAAVGNSGNTPVLVMTGNNKAPRFRIEIKSGAGGQNKNIVVLPGSPARGSQCAGAQLHVEAPIDTPAPAVAVAPVTFIETPIPTPAPSLPVAKTTQASITSPLIVNLRRSAGVSSPKAEGRVQAANSNNADFNMSMQRTAQGLRILLNNGLNADTALDAQDLLIGGVPTTLNRFYLIPAGSQLEITVPEKTFGDLEWKGVVIGSGEILNLTGQTP